MLTSLLAIILVQVDLDVERFATRNKTAANAANIAVGLINKPAVLVDKHGKIFSWYLPGFLDAEAIVGAYVRTHQVMNSLYFHTLSVADE